MVFRILALPRHDRLGASSRMRFFQFFPFLEAQGLKICVAPLLPDEYLRSYYAGRPINWVRLVIAYLRRLPILFQVRKFDLIWIEKELFPNLPAWPEMLLRRLGVPYVVDYDDAIFHNYDLSNNPLKKLLARKIDKVMHAAELVVCGNAYLAERARQAGARRVEILPTVIDLRRYAVRRRPQGKPPYDPQHERIIIGWVGSPPSSKYLQGITPVLQRLASKFPVQLRVIGAQFSVPGLDVECRAWTEENEVAEIQDFDIGIMPLQGSPWEQGKCGYKLIQYMACGVPCVASPIGVNGAIINNSVNGYLASNMEGWFAALDSLCLDADARRSMGDKGRLMVEQTYCLQVTAPRLAKLLAEVITIEAA